MKKRVLKKILATFLICVCILTFLPLNSFAITTVALTTEQIRSSYSNVDQTFSSWSDYTKVYGYSAVLMAEGAFYQGSTNVPGQYASFYSRQTNKLSGGHLARTLLDVHYAKFRTSTYDLSETDILPVRYDDTWETTNTSFITADVNFNSNGYTDDSYYYCPELTVVDVYFMAYVPAPYMYWAVKHVQRTGFSKYLGTIY